MTAASSALSSSIDYIVFETNRARWIDFARKFSVRVPLVVDRWTENDRESKVPVLFAGNGGTGVQLLDWGISTKDSPVEQKLIEGEKRLFGRRCIVLVREFGISNGCGDLITRFSSQVDTPMYLAGVWAPKKPLSPPGFALLTCRAGSKLNRYTRIQPIFISPANLETYIHPVGISLPMQNSDYTENMRIESSKGIREGA